MTLISYNISDALSINTDIVTKLVKNSFVYRSLEMPAELKHDTRITTE